jgi:hypothetical protein
VSSLLEVDNDTATGAIFYLVINGIITADSECLDSGIAMVQLIAGVPTVTRKFGDSSF